MGEKMRRAHQELLEARLRGGGESGIRQCDMCALDEHTDCISFGEFGARDLCECYCHQWD